DVAVGGGERLQDQLSLRFVQVERAGFFAERFGGGNSAGQCRPSRLAHRAREIADAYFFASGHDDAVLDGGAQLTHVAWPIVSEQRVRRFGRKIDNPLLVELGEVT